MRCTQAWKHLQYPQLLYKYSLVGPFAKCQDCGFDPVVVHIRAVAVTESVGNWARSQRVSVQVLVVDQNWNVC